MSETQPLLSGDVQSDGDIITSEHRIPAQEHNRIGGTGSEPNASKTRVYKARWYILLILCLSTILQNVIWGTWGPIADSAQLVFGWDTGTLFFVTNFGNIGNLLPLLCTAYVAQNKGLRKAMLLCTLTLVFAGGLRIITMEPKIATILISIGQFLSGVAGCLSASVPSQLSETWFPVRERTTATTFAVISNALGGSAAFILGPNIVSQPSQNRSNNSWIHNGSVSYSAEFLRIRHEIWILAIVEFGMAAALFLSTLVYFPSLPKLPPSISAGSQRLNFRQGLSSVLKQPRMWQVSLACAVPNGVFGNWVGFIYVIFKDIGVNQVLAGWFGFMCCTIGAVGAAFVGRIAGCFQQRLKTFILVLNVTVVANVFWILCLRDGLIPQPIVMTAVALVLVGILSNGQFALSYEIACEVGYPIHEGIIGTFLTLILNVAGIAFLAVQMIPNIGVTWMNWALLGVYVFGTVLLLFMKETYKRFEIDVQHGEYVAKSIQN